MPLGYQNGRFFFETEPGYVGDEYYVPNDSTADAPAEPIAIAPTPVTTVPQSGAETTLYIAAGGVPVPAPIPRKAATALPAPVVEGTPRFMQAEYAAALAALLPRGRAWSEDPGSVLRRLLHGLAASLERSDAAAGALLFGAIPGARSMLLGEWEATLGLPDPCAGPEPTIEQRLDQVRARFVGIGGQSRQHFTDFAAALGFLIEITNYAPFRIGQTPVGNPVAGDAWTFVWGVRILATSGTLGADVLVCELQAAKPAETTLVFLDDHGAAALADADSSPIPT